VGCQSVHEVKADSSLVEHFPTVFWLAILHYIGTDDKRQLHASVLIGQICVRHPETITAEVFLRLTNVSYIPQVAYEAAVNLIEAETSIVKETIDSGISSLQKALLGCADQKVAKHLVGRGYSDISSQAFSQSSFRATVAHIGGRGGVTSNAWLTFQCK
jgi:hypothetical protein